MDRKSQVKFGETFGIIIIVYFVIIAGFSWYNKENNKSINEMLANDKFERAFEIYYFVVNMDLIHVTERGVVDDELDINGLRAFEKFAAKPENKEYLRKQLAESSVKMSIFTSETIHEGDFNVDETLILYNNTPEIVGDVEIFRTLLPVINDREDRVDMGLLEVVVYVG